MEWLYKRDKSVTKVNLPVSYGPTNQLTNKPEEFTLPIIGRSELQYLYDINFRQEGKDFHRQVRIQRTMVEKTIGGNL